MRKTRSGTEAIFREIVFHFGIVLFVLGFFAGSPDGGAGRAAESMLPNLPILTLLAGLIFVIRTDPYLSMGQKSTLRLIIALVFCLIGQGFLDYFLSEGTPRILFRTGAAALGYILRPVILILFFYLLRPGRRYTAWWILIGVNTLIQLSAFFTDLPFHIDGRNRFHRGPLNWFCLALSAALLLQLLIDSVLQFRSGRRAETGIPLFSTLVVVASVLLDRFAAADSPLSYLTRAVVISSVFYYMWLHLQFLREHERGLKEEQRVQIMMSQIQPHFLFNTLNTIRALYTKDPPLAERTIEDFSLYLRQNLESLGRTEKIPLSRELEHTRLYAEIEKLRFPGIRVEYDIREADCLIPPLTVQPLVENAIRHGIRGRGDGWVRITSRTEGGRCVITVEDNGCGFDKGVLDGETPGHIGLKNVRARVEQMCHGTMTVDTAPGKGTRIEVSVPVGNG